MPNFSGNQKKTSSDSKRHFTVVMGNKEHGLYISSTPSSAAKKVAKKLCTSNKGKKVEFSLREITQGSKKKVYGPYIGYIEKLKDSGKIVVKNKKLSKKGGMKGGEGLDDIQVSIGKCGRRKKFSFTNPLKKCIVLSYNNRKITINYDAGKIIVKYFNNIDTNIYYKKIDYSVTKTDLPIFSIIIRELLNDQEVFLDQSRFLSLIIRINKFIKEIPNTDLKFSMINGWLDRILLTIPPQPIIPDIKPKPNKYQENLETQRKYQEKQLNDPNQQSMSLIMQVQLNGISVGLSVVLYIGNFLIGKAVYKFADYERHKTHSGRT